MCCLCRFLGGGIIVSGIIIGIIISVCGTFDGLATSCASVGAPLFVDIDLLGGEHAGDSLDLP
jgi:hypothetical protein